MPGRIFRPGLIILVYLFVEFFLNHICHSWLSYTLKLMEGIA